MDWQKKLQRALAHHQEGRLGPATELYQEVLAVVPEQPDANHLLGLVLDQSGNTVAGFRFVEKAVTLNPRHPVYQSNLGFLLSKLDRGADAERACRASIALDGSDADAHNNLGLALESQGPERLVDAAAAYAAAIHVDSRHMNATLNRGNVLRRLGRADEALAAFQAAHAIDARFPPATLNLASLLLELGRSSQAEKLARELVIAAPGYAKAHNLLGAALKAGRKLTEAEAVLHKAMELDPRDGETTVNLAGTLAEQLKYEAAETLFRQLLVARPDFASAHEGYGKLCVDRRRYATANEHLTRAVELRPDSYTGYALLGLCRIHHADILGALAAFERSHALLPFNDAVVSNYLFLWPSILTMIQPAILR